jgi:hypothetical protein
VCLSCEVTTVKNNIAFIENKIYGCLRQLNRHNRNILSKSATVQGLLMFRLCAGSAFDPLHFPVAIKKIHSAAWMWRLFRMNEPFQNEINFGVVIGAGNFKYTRSNSYSRRRLT